MDKTDKFPDLLAAVAEVGTLYDGLVYIGGIAVYLHAINAPATAAYAEATAVADLYISLVSLSELRTIEELTQNPRLGKQEFQKNGFSFDVYAERQSNLPVPYDHVVAHARQYDGISVAALEELLVLKLEAAAARHASQHGRKDAKDVIRILLLADLMRDFDAGRAIAFMQDHHFERLEAILRGPEFTALAQGNAKVAKALRVAAERTFEAIRTAYQGAEHDDAEPPPGERPQG